MSEVQGSLGLWKTVTEETSPPPHLFSFCVSYSENEVNILKVSISVINTRLFSFALRHGLIVQPRMALSL